LNANIIPTIVAYTFARPVEKKWHLDRADTMLKLTQ
jgi:hypothetical protein